MSRSDELHARAVQVIPGGVSSDYRHDQTPTFYARGAGSRLVDVDGHEVIDYVLGMGPDILGHAPVPVIGAVQDSLRDGQVYAGQHPREVELAELLVALIPCAERVRFLTSGTEATAMAVRLARGATGRPLIVKFEGHYHGWLEPLMVGCHLPFFSDEPGRSRLEVGGLDPEALKHTVVLPWNDPQAVEELLASRGAEVAAVVMEPAMVNAAVIPPAPGYLERVRAACDETGSLLIFDEVITGFRLGLAGAQGRFGVAPDIAVFAKAMGGGFPIAAVVGRAAVMDQLGDPRVLRDQVRPMNGGTFNAFVPSVAASLATIGELRRPGVFTALEQTGEALQQGLAELLRGLGIEHTIQGYGAAFWLDFGSTAPRSHADVRALDRSRYRAFVPLLDQEGVRVHLRGVWYLSTAHSDADVDATLAAVGRAVRRLP